MSNDNQVALTGNITRDPEMRFTPAQMAVVKFGIAVNKSKRQPDGSFEETPHYFDVTAFGSLAENIGGCLSKGQRVTVTGELEYQTWEDKETNEKKSKVAVVANDVAVSLRWATVAISKNAKGSGAGSAPSTAKDDDFWNS